MEETLILVNQDDVEIGRAEKISTHIQGILHRAFSVILFNQAGQILIQRRAAEKYHCPLLWANSCCGHPRPNEETLVAACRRVQEELGIKINLTKVAEIYYRLAMQNGLIEHEYTHVFVGTYDGLIDPNPLEVSETAWMSLQEIEKLVSVKPELFAPWFVLYVNQYKQIFDQSFFLRA